MPRSSRTYFLLFMTAIYLAANSCVPAAKSNAPLAGPENSVTMVPSEEELFGGGYPDSAYATQDYSWSPSNVKSGVTFKASNLPSWASFNSTTGSISGRPWGSGSFQNVTITAIKENKYQKLGPFSFQVIGDPLVMSSWHFKNTGQSGFIYFDPPTGTYALAGAYDLNIEETWHSEILGKGVKVAVSDDGVDFDHEDLKNKLIGFYSKDYTKNPEAWYQHDNQLNPEDISASHGTAVSGIIGAEGWNNTGSRGVAPKAMLGVFNFLESDQSEDVFFDQASDPHFDIFNYSYGGGSLPYSEGYTTSELNYPDYEDLLNLGFLTGRDGLGQIYVKSAGNEFELGEFNDAGGDYFTYGDGSGDYVLPQNANSDQLNTMPAHIVVGALNASGQRSTYSSIGSSVWVSAPGGEYGYWYPAILAADRSGCSAGYAASSAYTDFNKGKHSKNENCNYSNTMNGTSSAAPMVSGAIALMLEANPNLTARDVKHILAETAVKIQPLSQATSHYVSELNLEGHTWEQGWIKNAAGYYFHNFYGYGGLDVDAAVNMAKSYSSAWGDQEILNDNFSDPNYKKTVGSSIPDNSSAGLTSSITVSDELTIEAVRVMLNATHNRPGDLGFELTSPAGTKSILWHINGHYLFRRGLNSEVSVDSKADIKELVLLSNAFYGESSQGTWTLKAIDGLGMGSIFDPDSGDEADQSGSLDDWQISIVGH